MFDISGVGDIKGLHFKTKINNIILNMIEGPTIQYKKMS